MNSLVHTRGSLLDDADFASMLHHLAQYRTDEGVLSVYLDIPPNADCEVAAQELLAPLHAHTNDTWLQGRLEYEIEGVIQAVRAWRQPPARAAAMFFCGPGGLDAVVPLRFSIQPLARFARRPVISPLISALDEHRRFCAVMLERGRARIVTVMFGKVEEEISLETDRPQLRGPIWHVDDGSRQREGGLHAHAMRVVEHLWVIDRSRAIHALLLSGDEEALGVLRRILPRGLSNAVIDNAARFDIGMIGPDIAHRVSAIEQSVRAEEDDRLVARIREERPYDLAVKGWEPTLAAISAGRVQTLMLPGDDIARAGVFCGQDHFVALEAPSGCPNCGAELLPTEHVGEAAARAVLQGDGQVRVLAPGAAAELRPFGAAAILRY